MSRHHHEPVRDTDLLWFQRREFLRAAAAWSLAASGAGGALAQSRGNIVELQGDVLVNGQRLRPDDAVQTGDQVDTGPGSALVFVIGTSAFRVRQNSRFAVERGSTLSTVGLLRLVSGGIASVWGRGGARQIQMPTLTAGIRGTGVYAEVPAGQGGRSYLCNCYGTVDMTAGTERITSQTGYHQAFWGEPEPRAGRWLTPAGAINHADEEMEVLARLVGQRTAWQVLGRKGARDGKGGLDAPPYPTVSAY